MKGRQTKGFGYLRLHIQKQPMKMNFFFFHLAKLVKILQF